MAIGDPQKAEFEYLIILGNASQPTILAPHSMSFQNDGIAGVRAVVFDISGTVLDFGCCGPAAAFVELFARHGVEISMAEARRQMGLHKRDHIRMLLEDASIAERWAAANGTKEPAAELLQKLCAEFAPLLTEVLQKHFELIPGVRETVAELRRRKIKIASTTGFENGMIRDLIPKAENAGYAPDVWVCPDHVGKGRPSPWMMFYAAREMDAYPLHTFVKVGDTAADIAEGHAAGAWVVSVVVSGNEVGLSETELEAMSPQERELKLNAARSKLAACGPHYLIDTVADLVPLIDHISARIERGEMPCPAAFAEAIPFWTAAVA
jgi:phosphonoacetaldehyde hydrolase